MGLIWVGIAVLDYNIFIGIQRQDIENRLLDHIGLQAELLQRKTRSAVFDLYYIAGLIKEYHQSSGGSG
ncbi:MAG TPA: hypothetical protein ENN41_09770, partial [Sediminispirochaeta sp.]|nr:hypothetical protein [Sediminispirochaeta sp.]